MTAELLQPDELVAGLIAQVRVQHLDATVPPLQLRARQASGPLCRCLHAHASLNIRLCWAHPQARVGPQVSSEPGLAALLSQIIDSAQGIQVNTPTTLHPALQHLSLSSDAV